MKRPQALLFFLVACCLSHVAASAAPHIEQRDGLTIVYLEGSPYDLGKARITYRHS